MAHQIQQPPLTRIFGAEIADRFADEACGALDEHEVMQLRDFPNKTP
jgi:hypothetical protein